MNKSEAIKITYKSKMMRNKENRPDLNHLKAYAHLMEAEKLIGWKSLSFYIKRYGEFEHPGDAYNLTHI